MGKKRGDRVKEPVQVYLDRQDSTILGNLVDQTGLSKAELLRRALRELAQRVLTGKKKPGWSFDVLIGSMDNGPTDIAERHDYYLSQALEARKGSGARSS
jgi:hypothetical protein